MEQLQDVVVKSSQFILDLPAQWWGETWRQVATGFEVSPETDEYGVQWTLASGVPIQVDQEGSIVRSFALYIDNWCGDPHG